ncbi:hypothetical protein ACK8P5_00495 [Paenibacillus sp. EC2-1]|uniref:hypothetical protein n=1 Tax=Paenibacillus sp. EC2-1 TaxID=3388665 RepID=UPI003BEF46AD
MEVINTSFTIQVLYITLCITNFITKHIALLEMGFNMENASKTISFRADEETLEKMEQLKKNLFKNCELSNSELLRYSLNYLDSHYGKRMADTEKMYELVKSYIKAVFLNASRVEFGMLDDILYALEDVYAEYYVEEIEELGKLYDELEPITVAQLVRFKHKSIALIFLRIMGEDVEELESISDDDLANFLLKKFSEEVFKKEAKRLFHIDC